MASSAFGLTLLEVLLESFIARFSLSAILPMPAPVVYLSLFGVLVSGGLIVWWTVPACVKWVKYRLADGPSVDRFRELEADIRTCKNGLSRYYDARRRPSSGDPLRNAAESASLLADIEWLFAQLISLDIPLPDYGPYDDRRPRGEQFWLGYLGALERYARRGHLRGARLANLHQSIWETATIAEGDPVA